MVTLADFSQRSRCFFYDDYDYTEEAKNILEKDLSGAVIFLKDKLSSLDNFDKMSIENALRDCAKEQGLKARDLVHPVRVALTGDKVGPGLFEAMEVLGRETCLERVRAAINLFGSNE